jgi:serine/threonine protein phosphatase PrpC
VTERDTLGLRGRFFFVIASDGLWDVITNEDAIALVKAIEDPEVAAKKLIETAYAKGSADNITSVVVRFHHTRFAITELHNKPRCPSME